MQTNEELEVKEQTKQVAKKPRHWPWLELGVLAFYLALTIVLTWPLALNFGSAVPDGPLEDRYQNFWNFWWVGRALSNFQNPFETNALFYPYYTGGANPSVPLYLHTLQLLNCLLMLPLMVTAGVGAAYNGVIFFAFSVSGLGAFLLGRHLTKNFWAGLLAGIIYTFSVSHFGSMQASITNIMSIQWLPFYALSLLLWHERRNLKWAGVAAIFLALVVYTDWYNTIFVLFYTIFFYLVTSFPRLWLKQLPGVAVALVGGGILGSLAIIPAFFTLRSPIFAAQFDVNRDIRSSDTLLDLINLRTLDGALFWLGLIVGVSLIIAGGKWRRVGAYWLALYLVCCVFTLGPRLQIAPSSDPNPTNIPLPYALIKLIPGASVMRSPDRFDIPGQLGLAMLLAIGFSRFTHPEGTRDLRFTIINSVRTKILRRNPQPASSSSIINPPSSIVNLFLFLLLALPYLWLVNPGPLRLAAVEHGDFVNKLAQAKEGNYAILELPITRHYNFDHERMLNQIYHGQPIMGGYLARPVSDPYRTPESPFRYLADQDYVYDGDPNREIFAAQHTFALVDNLLRLYNFRYVVLYKDDYKFERERQGNRELIERQLGKAALVQEDAHTILYKVPDSLWQRPALTPALFTGEGWYGVEQNTDGLYRWMGQSADLYVTVAQPAKIRLALTVQAFGGDRSLRISANNQKLFEGLSTPAPQPVEVEFMANPGTTRLHLESLTPAQTAQQIGLGQDTRPLAFLVRNLKIQ